MLDLVLAILHHLLVFALFGILAAELITVRPGVSLETVKRVGTIDNYYGALAALIIIVGFSRAIFAAKGWAYYSHNGFFWAKIAAFAVVAILSVPPTIQYIRWARAKQTPGDQQVRSVRSFLFAEVGFFALLPIFAAAMARGYGEFQ